MEHMLTGKDLSFLIVVYSLKILQVLQFDFETHNF